MVIRQKRAVVLIMVLAVLVILALLGVTFATLTGMERTASRSYVDIVQAKLAAQSGIHFAMTNTRSLLSEKGFTAEFLYYGEDLDRSGGGEPSSESENQDGDGVLQTYNCPLGRAVHPSFMQDITKDGEITEDDLIEVKDQGGKVWRVGVSGLLPGTHKGNGDYYTVKVEDLSGRIYVNMENHSHLKTILENLAEEVGLDREVGSKILDNRPTGGYTTLEEIKARTDLTNEEYKKISRFLTVHAWCNKKVVKSVPLRDDPQTGQLGRFGHPNLGQQIYAWETLRPKKIDYPRRETESGYVYEGEIVGRAPVNINTAPYEVLVALLRGLEGFYLDEGVNCQILYNRYTIMNVRYTYSGEDIYSGTLGVLAETTEISRGLAQQIAENIIFNREIPEADKQYPWEGSFRSWQQFHNFCDKVLWLREGRRPSDEGWPEEVGILSAPQASVLKANFNPNSNINDFNPDYHRMFWVDKTDLTYYTTEFSFFPLGYFTINSIGRILGPKDRIMAEAEINVIVQLFHIYQQTSQQDFLYEWHSGPGKPIGEIISPNSAGGVIETAHNLTLQSYPEILDAEYIKDAHYDGYISLATVEHKPDSQFRASYTNSLDADSGEPLILDDTQSPSKGPYRDRLIAGSEAYLSGWKPGKLFPDGVYSEIESVPMYDYQPEDFKVMACALWVKPHFFPEAAGKVRTYLTFQTKGGRYGCFPLGIYNIVNRAETYTQTYWYRRYASYDPPQYVTVPEHIWTDDFGVVHIRPPYQREIFTSILIFEEEREREYSRGSVEINSLNGYSYHEAWDTSSFMGGGCSEIGEIRPDEDEVDWLMCWQGGVGTPCLNHINHDHDSIYRGGQRWGTLFRAGKWIHVAWVHHAISDKTLDAGTVYWEGNNYDIDALYVNGIKCAVPFGAGANDVECQPDYPPDYTLLDGIRNILRLGERKGMPRLNSAPDSTLDEVFIWEGLSMGDAEDEILNIYQDGRYYSGDDGVFTSREIDLASEMDVPEDTPITILIAAWTQYVPESLEELSNGEATCEVQIISVADGWTLLESVLSDPAGSLVKTYGGGRLTVTEPIRYQVLFKPNVGMLEPIVDSLIFDDITLIYYTHPKILAWSYNK